MTTAGGRLSTEEWKDLRNEVAGRLGRGGSRDEILFDICRRTGLDWTEAEAFVEEIEYVDRPKIVRWRSVLLMLVCLAVLLQNLLTLNPFSEGLLNQGFALLSDFSRENRAAFLKVVMDHWLVLGIWAVINGAALLGLVRSAADLIQPE